MSYSWRDYLVFAQNIKADPTSPGPKEAALRSAVSRAYYSAYHCALELGEKHGFNRTHFGNDHKLIIDFLSQSGNPKFAYLSVMLGRLKEKRTCADYDDSLDTDVDRFAMYAFSEVTNFFNAYDTIE